MKKGATGECRLRRQMQNRDQLGGEEFSRGDIHECARGGEGVRMWMQ